MLKTCRELGFEVKTDPEDLGLCDVTLVSPFPAQMRRPGLYAAQSKRAGMTSDLLVFLRGKDS